MEKRFQLEGALPKKAVIMGIALMAVIALTYFSSVNYLRQSTTDMLVAGATCNKSCGLYNCNQACGFCNDCTETGCDLTAGKPCEDAPRDCPCPLSRKDACSNYAIPNCISSCGQTRQLALGITYLRETLRRVAPQISNLWCQFKKTMRSCILMLT